MKDSLNEFEQELEAALKHRYENSAPSVFNALLVACSISFGLNYTMRFFIGTPIFDINTLLENLKQFING